MMHWVIVATQFFVPLMEWCHSIELAMRQIPGTKKLGRHRMRVHRNHRSLTWYIVVRNPYAREYSHYCYRRNNRPRSALKRRVLDMTFSEYVQSHTSDPQRWEDVTQSEWFEAIKPDKVLRFEELPECVTNLPWWPSVKFPHKSRASIASWQDAYDEETAMRVLDWARMDFEQFGYDPAVPGI